VGSVTNPEPGILMTDQNSKPDTYHQIDISFFTHNGGVRTNNEDSLLVDDLLISDRSMDKPLCHQTAGTDIICCVADGIGGSEKGEVASNLVLSALRNREVGIKDNESLISAIAQGKESLEKYVLDNPDAANLGCTLAGISIFGDSAIVFNAGDCRVYRINGNYFEQISRDHSVVQALFEEGIITEDEMRYHPKRNIVTSSVSGDGNPNSVKLFFTRIPVRVSDIFFVCCDGIWGCFSHDELELIYKQFKGYEFCEKLQGAAIARKASDNISAILIQISSVT
jgi:PPM family protein phosphatase